MIERFRKIGVGAAGQYVGRYPIAEPESLRAGHFCFLHDGEGLRRIDYRREGHPALPNTPYFAFASVVFARGPDHEDRSYRDATGASVPNHMGVYTHRVTFDGRGHPSVGFGLDAAGRRVADNSGAYEVRWKTDGRGGIVEEAYHDEAGRLMETTDGVATVRLVHDERGNRIETRFFGADGRPREHRHFQVAAIRAKYDDHGNQTELRYFDAEGRPKQHRKFGFMNLKAYDSRGNKVEERFFDAAGRPIACWFSAVVRWTYDDVGNLLKIGFYDAADRPSESNRLGVASSVSTYDASGRKTEQYFYGADGRLKGLKAQRCAVIRWVRDPDGKVQKKVLLDENERVLSEDSSPNDLGGDSA